MTRPTPDNERFLSRWSRLKREHAGSAEAASLAPSVPPPLAAQLPAAAPAAPAAGEGAAATLPAIELLTMDSDFAQFFQAKVPDTLRRAAVKKLFADPHFNIMDGLDTYIDDYSKPDPIPCEMLARLVQARDIIDHPSNRQPEAADPAPATAAIDAAAPPDQQTAVEHAGDAAAAQAEQRVAAAFEGQPAEKAEKAEKGPAAEKGPGSNISVRLDSAPTR
jgi:hypothetical protein